MLADDVVFTHMATGMEMLVMMRQLGGAPQPAAVAGA